MYPDVADLRDFYQTPAGRIARRMIRRQVRTMWPNLRDLSVLGVGYATPYLRPFAEQAERVVTVMPAQQGVLRWPVRGETLRGECCRGFTREHILPGNDIRVLGIQ